MTSKELYNLFLTWLQTSDYDIILTNSFIWKWEMDVFRMLDSWYIYEYEVKVSRQDFFNDFLKWEKHNDLNKWNRECNRFFFVVPWWLVKEEEVPEKYWLIYVNTKGSFKVIRNAKLLHRKKLWDNNEFQKYLLKKLAFRDSIRKRELDSLKRKFRRLEKWFK